MTPAEREQWIRIAMRNCRRSLIRAAHEYLQMLKQLDPHQVPDSERAFIRAALSVVQQELKL